MTSRTVLVGLITSVIVFAGCSASSTPTVSGAVIDPAGEDVAESALDTDESATSELGVGPAIDFELFSADEGAGCGVFVSVPEDAVTDDIDLRDLLWRGIVENEFTECGFSEVVEVGLITVDGLDNYDQPDWSMAVEHVFYSVSGWSDLVESCSIYPLDAACALMLQASLTG